MNQPSMFAFFTQVTAFVDASNVYGSTLCEMRRLRAFVGGRLNVTKNTAGGKPLLPQVGALNERSSSETCILTLYEGQFMSGMSLFQTATHKECRAPSRLCFTAGDNRASEQPGLATMHTLFVRAHNYFVDGLSQVNQHWDDEKLYQEGTTHAQLSNFPTFS